MRLLFLTNLYPPGGHGGYEQWCQEVAQGLRERGHMVRVLTTTGGLPPAPDPDPEWVVRGLRLEMEFASLVNGLRFFTQRQLVERDNLECLQQEIFTFRPEAVMIWGMWNLHRSLAAVCEALMPGRVLYYMGDYWPTLPSQMAYYWQAPARTWKTRLPKALLKPIAEEALRREVLPQLRFERVLFPSEFLQTEYRRLNVPVRSGQVVMGAIDTRPYTPQVRQKVGPLAMLYAGRLLPDKGVETAIDGVAELVQRGEKDLHLTIVGSGTPDYESDLRERVQENELESFVTFTGAIPKETMPALYPQFDVFLFTSIWQEPFGRVIVEAMASGVVVVGTGTGGAGEILGGGTRGLIYPPGEAHALAEAVLRLMREPDLRQRLVKAGRQAALEQYDLKRMVAEIEAVLIEMVA